jgi:hypothetical protein
MRPIPRKWVKVKEIRQWNRRQQEKGGRTKTIKSFNAQTTYVLITMVLVS